MTESPATKFIAAILIVVAPFAMGAFFLAWGPAGQYQVTDPKNDGYVPPRIIEQLLERTQESTVTVWCEPKVGKSKQGTAFAIALKTDVSDDYPTSLITNHHVIENCVGVKHELSIALPYEEPVAAVVVKWDEENDLAVIATKQKLPLLGLSKYDPYPGYWVMALGSADGYEGSVSFGNVINSNSSEILVTNNISGGSSGGPLVDNEGNVVAVVSWSLDEKQYNGTKSLNAFCAKILKCAYGANGKKTWWDYADE